MSEPRGQLRKEHLTFPGCSHFRRLDDNHEKCQSCMYGGAPGCTRLSRCHFCADWTSSMWDAEEKNRQAAVKRRIRKKDKKASASSTGEPMRPGYESSSEVFSSRNPSPAHSRTSGYSGKGPSPKVHSRDETRVERGRSPSRGRHGVDEERIELVRSPAKAPRHEVRVERVRSPSPVCHERMEPFCSPSVTRGQERSPGVDTLLDYDEKGLSDDDFIGYDDFPKGFQGPVLNTVVRMTSCWLRHLALISHHSRWIVPRIIPVELVSFAIGKRRVPRGPYPLVMVSPVGLGRAIRVLLRPLVMRTVVGCDVPGVRRCPPLIRKVLSGWTRIMSRTWILCYGIPARLCFQVMGTNLPTQSVLVPQVPIMNPPAAAAGAPGQQASDPKFTMREFMDLMKFAQSQSVAGQRTSVTPVTGLTRQPTVPQKENLPPAVAGDNYPVESSTEVSASVSKHRSRTRTRGRIFPMTAGGTLDQDLGLRLGRNPPPAGHQGPQGAAGKGGIPNHQHQDRGCLMMTGQTLWCPHRGTAFSGMLSALPEAPTRQWTLVEKDWPRLPWSIFLRMTNQRRWHGVFSPSYDMP